MNLSEQNVLVTGGAGFIGSHLVDMLLEDGCHVRVLDNLANGKLENLAHHQKNSHFEFQLGTITDPFDVAKAMEHISVVFNLACLGVRHALRHPFENHRVNAEGTLLLLQEAYRCGISKFIQCSSSEVYGTAITVPMHESHPTFPCTVYGASKLASEAYARAYYKTNNFNTVIVRPFNTYGPRSHHEGDAGEMIPKSIVRALNNRSILIFGDGSQTRDFTFVTDTARGLMAAAQSDDTSGQTFNLGSQFEVSIKEVAERIICVVQNQHPKIEFIRSRRGDVLRLYANSEKFIGLTGWKPLVSYQQGLAWTVNWFRDRPEGAQALLKEEEAINWE